MRIKMDNAKIKYVQRFKYLYFSFTEDIEIWNMPLKIYVIRTKEKITEFLSGFLYGKKKNLSFEANIYGSTEGSCG